MSELDMMRGNIGFLRERHGWTQQELADRLGIKKKTLAAYEQRRSVPPLDVILMMMKLFVIDFNSFVNMDLRKSMPRELVSRRSLP